MLAECDEHALLPAPVSARRPGPVCHLHQVQLVPQSRAARGLQRDAGRIPLRQRLHVPVVPVDVVVHCIVRVVCRLRPRAGVGLRQRRQHGSAQHQHQHPRPPHPGLGSGTSLGAELSRHIPPALSLPKPLTFSLTPLACAAAAAAGEVGAESERGKARGAEKRFGRGRPNFWPRLMSAARGPDSSTIVYRRSLQTALTSTSLNLPGRWRRPV